MAAVATVWSVPALADGPTSGVHEYLVDHYALGDIGNHVYTFTRNGDELTVTAKVRLEAKILFVTVRRYSADRTEVWRKGRLVAYESRTDDDGVVSEVTARAEGDKLVIQGPKGRIEAPANIVPSSAWSLDFLRTGEIMDTETGELLAITVTPDGTEEIEANGGLVTANRYQISGALDRTLWFAEDGTWLKMRLTRGSDVIYVIKK